MEDLLKEYLIQVLYFTDEETEAGKGLSGHRKTQLQSWIWDPASQFPSPASHRVPLDDLLVFSAILPVGRDILSPFTTSFLKRTLTFSLFCLSLAFKWRQLFPV